MYTMKQYSGMVTSKQKKLDIYKYIKPEDGYEYISKPSYLSGDKPAEVFDKETAKVALFKFYFEGATGKELTEFFKSDKPIQVGWANGRTLTMLGFGIRDSDKETGVRRDNQRGILEGKVSTEEAKRMLDQVIEYVYE